MSAREFAAWQAYYSIEPFGEERADLRQAITSALVHNSNVDGKKHKAKQVTEFMPFHEEPEPDPKGPDELYSKFMSLGKRGR